MVQLCDLKTISALLASGLVPACSSLYISEAASRGSCPIPDTGKLLQTKWFSMLLCALPNVGTQHFFFMEGLCCDWEPLLWTLMIWIPGSRLFKPQLLWDRQFGLFRIYPFPVPCPSPSLSSLFYPWLSKKLADMIIHRTEPRKSDSKAKENLLHIIFIISIFIIWQLQVSSSNSFIRC